MICSGTPSKLDLGYRLKTKVSFKAIRGRAGELSLLRRKDLYIDERGGDRRFGSRGGSMLLYSYSVNIITDVWSFQYFSVIQI